MIDGKLFFSWVRATWFGWLLGIPIIIVLALIGEAVHIGGAQFLVGAGMGTGIGLMQARVIRRILPKAVLWICSCIVGLGAPFLLTDLSKFVGWNLPYSLPAAIGLGGLLIGIWQALILRSRLRQSGWWIVASVLGWTLAAGMPALADSPRLHAIRGIWGALAYLGIIAAGGLILGIVTGLCLAWLVRSESAV
jgi:hypothetical protein